MKSFILALCLLVSTTSFSPKKESKLYDECFKAASALPELSGYKFNSYTIKTSTEDGTIGYKNVKIAYLADDNITLMLIDAPFKGHTIIGYHPGWIKGSSVRLGEFVAYNKTNNNVKCLKKYSSFLSEPKENKGEFTEFLLSDDHKIMVESRDDGIVKNIMFNDLLYILPKNYKK